MNGLLFRAVKNKYRSFPINVTLDLCEEYAKLGHSEIFGLRSTIKYSNFQGCPCEVVRSSNAVI